MKFREQPANKITKKIQGRLNNVLCEFKKILVTGTNFNNQT